jgi:hypothetical protein
VRESTCNPLSRFAYAGVIHPQFIFPPDKPVLGKAATFAARSRLVAGALVVPFRDYLDQPVFQAVLSIMGLVGRSISSPGARTC